MTKCLIAGSRNIHDYKVLCDHINLLGLGFDTVISGGAAGVDKLGEKYAEDNELKLIRYLPDWNTYGKKAGPIRNEAMVNACDFAIIIFDGKSPGTLNTLGLLDKHHKEAYVKIIHNES